MVEKQTEKRVLLIVDDKPENLDILINFLEKCDFNIKVADSGEEVFNRLKSCRPDIILLDILMPGIDGFETCRRLKNSENHRDIPVIFMSALDEVVDKVKGLNLGAVDYITKPFMHAEVLARVTNHLHIQELKNKLESAKRKLEKRVEERTVELEITNQKLIEEIEERKNAEKEISMLAHAIKSIRDSVCVTDLDENVIFVNDAFVNTYGLKREEILGKHIGPIRSQKNTANTLNGILPETIKRGGWQGEIISKKRDGQEFHAFLSTSIIYDEKRAPVALVEVITDISEQKNVEEAYHKMSEKLLDACEEERTRIAMELHDGLGQGMLTTKLSLQIVNRDLMDPHISNVITALDNNINDLRNICRGFKPVLLKNMGIAPAVKSHCRIFSEMSGIKIDVFIDIKSRPRLVVEEHLFRILQEALCNITRHSEAKGVKIKLDSLNDNLVMTIEDNGKGFDYSRLSAECKGIGLFTMKERVAIMNGNFNIESTKQKGTKIIVEVPVDRMKAKKAEGG